jgi:methyl-accepting chemotaxis protein
MDLGSILGKLDGQGGDLADLLQLLTNNKEQLAMLGRLPDYLEKIASGLAGAGEQAKSAAVSLVGDDGSSGLKGTLADSSDALAKIVTSIGNGAARIADAAESAAKVPLMDGPASRLASAAEEMSGATEQLGKLAEAMDQIGETLAQVGVALARLGDHLDDSGAQARGFAELG